MIRCRKRGYYIMTHIRNNIDLFSLKRCVKSIITFDTSYDITIVDDNSLMSVSDDDFFKIHNVQIIKNTWFPGSAEIFPYWYNRKFRQYDVFITLHDSMILKRSIPDSVWDKKCCILWYFDRIKKLKHLTNSMRTLCDNMKYGDIIFDTYFNKLDRWVGCFGVTALVEQSLMDIIFEKYNFENVVSLIDNHKKREACERILGIFFSLELGKANVMKNSLGGSIFDHPYKYIIDLDASSSFEQLIEKYKNVNAYLIKTWKGR